MQVVCVFGPFLYAGVMKCGYTYAWVQSWLISLCVSLAASPARTDSSVATDGKEDVASVISWADRCGKFEHQTVAWLGLLLANFGQKMITHLCGDLSVYAPVLVRFVFFFVCDHNLI